MNTQHIAASFIDKTPTLVDSLFFRLSANSLQDVFPFFLLLKQCSHTNSGDDPTIVTPQVVIIVFWNVQFILPRLHFHEFHCGVNVIFILGSLPFPLFQPERWVISGTRSITMASPDSGKEGQMSTSTDLLQQRCL